MARNAFFLLLAITVAISMIFGMDVQAYAESEEMDEFELTGTDLSKISGVAPTDTRAIHSRPKMEKYFQVGIERKLSTNRARNLLEKPEIDTSKRTKTDVTEEQSINLDWRLILLMALVAGGGQGIN